VNRRSPNRRSRDLIRNTYLARSGPGATLGARPEGPPFSRLSHEQPPAPPKRVDRKDQAGRKRRRPTKNLSSSKRPRSSLTGWTSTASERLWVGRYCELCRQDRQRPSKRNEISPTTQYSFADCLPVVKIKANPGLPPNSGPSTSTLRPSTALKRKMGRPRRPTPGKGWWGKVLRRRTSAKSPIARTKPGHRSPSKAERMEHLKRSAWLVGPRKIRNRESTAELLWAPIRRIRPNLRRKDRAPIPSKFHSGDRTKWRVHKDFELELSKTGRDLKTVRSDCRVYFPDSQRLARYEFGCHWIVTRYWFPLNSARLGRLVLQANPDETVKSLLGIDRLQPPFAQTRSTAGGGAASARNESTRPHFRPTRLERKERQKQPSLWTTSELISAAPLFRQNVEFHRHRGIAGQPSPTVSEHTHSYLTSGAPSMVGRKNRPGDPSPALRLCGPENPQNGHAAPRIFSG